MAKRLTARVSAGAALVTGMGLMGIATAAPSQAEIVGDLEYDCNLVNEGIATDFTDPWHVNLSVDVPDQVDPGESIPAPSIVATIVPGQDAEDTLRGQEVKTLEGTSSAEYSVGGESRTAELTVPVTEVPAEGDITTVATGTGEAETAPAEEGAVDVAAGDFDATLTFDSGFVANIECTAPADNVIGSVTVGDAPPEPPTEPELEVNDWYIEPSLLEGTTEGYIISGTAETDGTINVVQLDADGNELKTDSLTVTAGEVNEEVIAAEGMRHIRLDSVDCVDANGNTAEDGPDVEGGNGCSVIYSIDVEEPTDPEVPEDPTEPEVPEDPTEPEVPEDPTEPEVPEVVQTDGIATTTGQDNTAAIALGSLLLAGAGAGTVLVARRRATTTR